VKSLVYNNTFLIVEVSPAHNEQSVPVNNGVSVRFGTDMDADTINSGTLLLRKVNGEAILSTVSYDRTYRKATLQPSVPLETGTQYQFSVLGGENGVKTVVAKTLPETKRYEFTTTSNVLISAPKNLKVVNDNGHLTLSWLQPDQFDTSKDLSYRVAVSTSNLTPVDDAGAVVWPLATDSIQDPVLTSIAVSRHLPPNVYYAYAQAYIEDEAGEWAQFQFEIEPAATTGGGTGSGGSSGGYASIEVIDTYPKANAVHVLPNTVKVLFSANLDMSTISNQTVYILKKDKPATLSFIDLLTEYSPSNGIPFLIDSVPQANLLSLTIDTQDLENNAEYTIILRESIKDTDGNTLGDAYFWSFTSTYYPLYGNPDMIKQDLKAVLSSIPDKTLYSYMQVTSQTALDTVISAQGLTEEAIIAAVPRYMNEYVRAQTSYDLLMAAVLEKTATVGTMRVLGDLTIDNSRAQFSPGQVLAGFKERIKPWLDELHGHHNRGYAKPTTVVRGEAVEEYPDYFTRSELKDIDA
jgi:hypothetical protein